MKPRRKSIGITVLLSVTTAGLVLLSAGLVLALSFQTAWRSTSELLYDQAALAMTWIEQEIHSHINPAYEIAQFMHAQVAAGAVDPGDRDELATAFRGALAAAPQVAGVVVWDRNLTRMEVRRGDDGQVTVIDRQDDITPALREMANGIRAAGGPSWGPPTEGDSESNYVNARAPLERDGRFWGVMATGVTINNLSAIVQRVGDSLQMTAFVLYGEQLVAHPKLQDLPTVRDAENFARLRSAAEVGDAVVAQFHAHAADTLDQWQSRDDGLEGRLIRNPDDGLDYFVLSRAHYGFGPEPWHIGIYGASETLDEYFDRLFAALIAGLGVLIIAIACALYLARKISRPIRALAGAAERIGRLELSRVGGIKRTGIRELDEQAGAFNHMLDGLRWFETYVPKRLVRQLIQSRDVVASKEVELSVMFTDIIGFTSLSEAMQPGEVGAMVNAHFEVVARCIEASGGTLDKYIGDAVMAFWGAPERQADHAIRACRAALAIADELAAEAGDGDGARARLTERGRDGDGDGGISRHPRSPLSGGGESPPAHPPVRIKIAIHSGPLLVGNIGASARMNYTVIGDTVNACSRIESLCGQFDDGAPAVILVSADTVRLASAEPDLRFEEVGAFEVKGRSEKVHVSRLRRA